MAETQMATPGGQPAAAPAPGGTSQPAGPAGTQEGGAAGQPTPPGTTAQPGAGTQGPEVGRGSKEPMYQQRYQDLLPRFEELQRQFEEDRAAKQTPAQPEPEPEPETEPEPQQPQPQAAAQQPQSTVQQFFEDPTVQEWTGWINGQLAQYDHLGPVGDSLRQRALGQCLGVMQQRDPRLHAAYTQAIGYRPAFQPEPQRGLTPEQVNQIVAQRIEVLDRNTAQFASSMQRLGVFGDDFLKAEIIGPDGRTRMSRRDAIIASAKTAKRADGSPQLDARAILLDLDPAGVFERAMEIGRARGMQDLMDAQLSGQLDPGRMLANLGQQQPQQDSLATKVAQSLGIPTERRTS